MAAFGLAPIPHYMYKEYDTRNIYGLNSSTWPIICTNK
jgi:hypothetical protein